MQPKWRSRRFLTLAVCIGLLMIAVSTYVLARGTNREHTPSVVAIGTLEADEIVVSAKISARVSQLHAAEGQEIAAGGVLLTLDGAEQAAQREATLASLHDAEAQLAVLNAGARVEEIERMRAQVAEAQHNLQAYVNGSRTEEILQARATLRAAEAAQQQAERDRARFATLFGTGDIARSQLEQAETALHAANSRLEVSRQQLALLTAGPRSEETGAAREKVRQLQASYDLLRAGPRKEEIAAARWRVESIKASLKLVDIQLGDARITSPVKALVTDMVANVGEVVRPGQPIATLVSRTDAWVDVFVEETSVGLVEIGQAAELSFKAFPDSVFAGRVSSINETMVGERQTKDSMNIRTLRVRVQVAKGHQYMRPGMSVEVRILTGPRS